MDTNIAPDRSFSVVIASTGRELPVPQGHTILDVLFDADIDIPTSCEEGVCGTCRTRVLEGIPDHRDVVLTSLEKSNGEFIMVCCSRSKSARLVLDL